MKITIVGGGTAGWLSALYLLGLKDSDYEITIIDSSKIPIIGAGEGSTGLLTDTIEFHKHLGVNELDFLNETGATPKLGIRFKDWKGSNDEYLSPIIPSNTTGGVPDYYLLYSIWKDLGFSETNLFAYMMENDLSTYHKDLRESDGTHAYHFDAFKVSEYFKKVCSKHNIEIIDSEIVSCAKNSLNGELLTVMLDNGEFHSSDLWLDCTGFARTLITEVGNEFRSYEDNIPVNAAIPFLREYDHNEIIKPETLAWAQKNGWMWQIPTRDRMGCGYVYNNNFVSYDNAIDELEKTIGRKIEPIRDLKFRPGKISNMWEKNVIGIGLSSVFIEPLQATSIHITIVQLMLLTNEVLKKKKEFTLEEKGKYNSFMNRLCDDYVTFLQIHYLTKRNDSDFWKFCNHEMVKTERTKEIIKMCEEGCPIPQDFNMYFGYIGWGLYSYTLGGIGQISKFNSEQILSHFTEFNCEEEIKKLQLNFKDVTQKYLSNTELIKLLQNKGLNKNWGSVKNITVRI